MGRHRNLGTELRDRYAATEANLGLVLNLLVTDYTKLTANLQAVGGAWQIGYPLSSDVTRALSLGTTAPFVAHDYLNFSVGSDCGWYNG
jgi:hypothetical protein